MAAEPFTCSAVRTGPAFARQFAFQHHPAIVQLLRVGEVLDASNRPASGPSIRRRPSRLPAIRTRGITEGAGNKNRHRARELHEPGAHRQTSELEKATETDPRGNRTYQERYPRESLAKDRVRRLLAGHAHHEVRGAL